MVTKIRIHSYQLLRKVFDINSKSICILICLNSIRIIEALGSWLLALGPLKNEGKWIQWMSRKTGNWKLGGLTTVTQSNISHIWRVIIFPISIRFDSFRLRIDLIKKKKNRERESAREKKATNIRNTTAVKDEVLSEKRAQKRNEVKQL